MEIRPFQNAKCTIAFCNKPRFPALSIKMAFIIKFVLILLAIRTTLGEERHSLKVLDEYEYSDENENNMCSALQEYEEEVLIPVNVTVLETVKEKCFDYVPFFTCSRERYVTKEVNKTTVTKKTRTVFKCCKGYERLSNGTCKPVCARGCVHGHCTHPGYCYCDAGWDGENCTKECDKNWWGPNCFLFCDCWNGETCDRFNGTCFCSPGFTGQFCEIACKGAINGRCNQISKCSCMNGGVCRSNDSACICLPGYNGTKCETICDEWTFGDNCSGTCTCDKNRTELCGPIDGKCHCMPGWRGSNCDEPCELGTWGRHCVNNCSCGPKGTCHPESGVCSCPAGWHGESCEEKCPIGFFEKDCKMKCPDCSHMPGTCHHETGWCNCPPGKTGGLCDLECPFGKFGVNCTEFCLCNHNSTCDSITGTCSCTPGWTGTYCTNPCPIGTYGINCSSSCNCSICDNEDGRCIDSLIDNIGSLLTVEEPTYIPIYVSLIYGFFLLIIVGLFLCALFYIKSHTLYGTSIYENVRRRFQERIFFKTPQLRKEDSSTSNISQEEVPTVNPSSQFTNPLYYATEEIVNSNSRPTSTVHPVHATNEPNQALPIEDVFENVEFSIPESELASCPEKSDIKISFEKKNMDPIITYSNTGGTYSFPLTVEKLSSSSDSKMTANEYRYEKLTGEVSNTIPKK